MVPAIQYWANAIAAGKGNDVMALFERTMSPDLLDWMQQRQPAITERLTDPDQMKISTDDS
jgi:hypothetical protein